jgi:hypothetical protein
MKGMNLQGVVRSRIHPGKSYTQMIASIAEVLKDLGVDACRIGGTPMEGAKFDEDLPGYGRLGEQVWDGYNYPIAMLDVMQEAGISKVYISLHNKQGAERLTESDVKTTLQLARERGIVEITFSDDCEPYSPQRTQEGSYDYEVMRANRALLQKAGYRMAWPLLYASSNETESRRRRREHHTDAMLEGVDATPENQLFEVHLYCPLSKWESPEGFMGDALGKTAETLAWQGFVGDTGPGFVVGEWSGNNQETFSDEQLENVVASMQKQMKQRSIENYYQLLGSEFDIHGLFNFSTGTPNRCYEIIKNG